MTEPTFIDQIRYRRDSLQSQIEVRTSELAELARVAQALDTALAYYQAETRASRLAEPQRPEGQLPTKQQVVMDTIVQRGQLEFTAPEVSNWTGMPLASVITHLQAIRKKGLVKIIESYPPPKRGTPMTWLLVKTK